MIARIPQLSHISALRTENLHWLPLSARIKFKEYLPRLYILSGIGS